MGAVAPLPSRAVPAGTYTVPSGTASAGSSVKLTSAIPAWPAPSNVAKPSFTARQR